MCRTKIKFSYLILSYLILSYLILSYLILSYLILSYLILSYHIYICTSTFFLLWTKVYADVGSLSILLLYLPSTERIQQVEDYVRGCTISTKYWTHSTSWRLCQRLYYFYQVLNAFDKLKIMSEVVLFLPSTERIRQVEDYVRGCTISTKYWTHSTSWRLCQRLYYIYQVLNAFNKLKIMSEVVLYLPSTERIRQVEDYVRGCTISTKYWTHSTSWRLCQRLYYFYQVLNVFNI
jgi:uncharacterized protein (DUF1499 family)